MQIPELLAQHKFVSANRPKLRLLQVLKLE